MKVDLTTYVVITICSIVIPPLFVINVIVLLIQLIPRMVAAYRDKKEREESINYTESYIDNALNTYSGSGFGTDFTTCGNSEITNNNGLCENVEKLVEVETVDKSDNNVVDTKFVIFSKEDKSTLWADINAVNIVIFKLPALKCFNDLLLIDMVNQEMLNSVKSFFSRFINDMPNEIKIKLNKEVYGCFEEIIEILCRY